MRLSDESLRHRPVIAADGQVVGEIAVLFLDSALRVEGLLVKLRNDVADRLGADRSVFRSGTVEIPTRFVQSVADTVVLNVPVDDLRSIVPGDQQPVHAR